jgi:L-histidine N-alpha-methyltransferase
MPYDDEDGPDGSVVLSGSRTVARHAQPVPGLERRAHTEQVLMGQIHPRDVIAQMALEALLAPRKTLPPSLFYDEEGCRLFYEITKLPEYYLTRTEFRLLETIAPEVAALLPVGATLVEYGASDETKAEKLLAQKARVAAPQGDPTGGPTGSPTGGRTQAPFDLAARAFREETVFRTYIPIDVAEPALRAMRDRLAVHRPNLSVAPVTADFMWPVELPERKSETAVMGFFPGSTIGNLEPGPAVVFLGRVRATLGYGAKFLLGFDTCRDPARLIRAYDDRQGVTAQFNRNLLVRLNREAGATFDPETFAHRAIWNEAESRIEMHLVSGAARTVMVAGRPVHFARDESIHTENSYKYSPERMRTMIEAAGWTVSKTWSDSNGLFALWLLD